MKVFPLEHVLLIFSIIIISVTLSLTNDQLVLQQDAFTNSYSVETPSFQSSFTRIFGGQQQQQKSPVQSLKVQPQPLQAQQYMTQPQRQFYRQPQFQQQQGSTLSGQSAFYAPSNDLGLYSTNQLVQQNQPARQAYAEQSYFDQQQPISSLLPLQQQHHSPHNQIQQLHRQQQLIEQYKYQTQQLVQQIQLQKTQSQQLQQAQSPQYIQNDASGAEQQISQNFLNVKYSPSVDVSSVKFSSTGLNYTF